MRKRSPIYSLIFLLTLGSMMPMLTSCTQKTAARAGDRIVNRLLRRGQRQLRRSMRELRKTRKVPMEEKTVRSSFTVIGTEPSWMVDKGMFEEKEQYYNLLSYLIVGEYDVNPITGAPRNTDALNEVAASGIADTAFARNGEIALLIPVSYHGDFGTPEPGQRSSRENVYRDFLLDDDVQRDLRKQLLAYIQHDSIRASGFVLDFRNIPQDLEEDFTRFVNSMGNWARNNQLIMMIKVPAHNGRTKPVLSQEVLRKLKADQSDPNMAFIIIEARDMQRLDTLSPSAPIHAPDNPMDLERAVAYYLEAGVPPGRLIVEFPYYGYEWYRSRSGHRLIGQQAQRMRQDLPRMPVRRISYFGKEGGKRRGEGNAEGAYYETDEGKVFSFEDSLTIARKYGWVKEQALGGIGLYALGYNGGDLKMWEALSGDFSANPPAVTYPIIAFLILCLGGGIVYSVIRYWQVRNEIARKRSHQWYYGGALFMVCVVFLCCMIYVIPTRATAGSSMILVMFPFLRRILSKVRRWV